MKNIPFYQAYITNADEGIIRISLVDDPAVESYFVAFEKEQEEYQTFSIENEEERMICGVVMRCNFPIYRRRGDFEYYQIYNAETIKIMAEKMMFDNTQNNINLFHTEGTDVDGVNLVQLFIKDTEKGINPVGFENIENGSLFAQYKVENDEIWAAIKDGTFKGFSLEGYFTIVEEEIEKNNKEENNKSIMSKIKEIVSKILTQFGAVETDKGTIVWESSEDLKAGDIVTLEDGSQPENGDYKTEDGKTITIEDGKVAKIEDAEAEVAPKDAFDKVKAQFEATYQDVQNNIYSALKDAGIYGYIVENTNEYAVVSVWGADDMEHLYRYSISIGEDGFVTLGEMIEVEVKYEPKSEEPTEEPKADEFAEQDPEPEPEPDPEPEFDAKKEIEDLKAKIEAMSTEIETLKTSLAELVEKPAVPPVAEEFEKVTEFETGNSKLDKICKRVATLKH